MADGAPILTARTVSSIEEIGESAWNRLVANTSDTYHPFISYAFLHALETSGSVGTETGWMPFHMVLEQDSEIIGTAPLYVKMNSQGEYVFDHHWADAYRRAGGRYYPKLVCAAPFTPVPGPRFLSENDDHRQAMAGAIIQLAEQFGASSAHINFVTKGTAKTLMSAGFLPRQGTQFHWHNRDYSSFDDFLSTFSSRKRKAVKRERREAVADGLVIRQLQGNEITEEHWDAFWEFYQDTGARKWGEPYLTRKFFDQIAETMSSSLLLIVAEREGLPIAGALNFIGGDTLYGRYWGCTEDHPFLHFEICYHQAVEYAVNHGLQRVEAGAQGEHKLARGYEPVVTHSAHWIRDPSFRTAIANYLEQERAQGEAEIEILDQYTPYKSRNT